MRYIFVLGKLGANAILGVSLAVCKAGAAKKVPFYKSDMIAFFSVRVWSPTFDFGMEYEH